MKFCTLTQDLKLGPHAKFQGHTIKSGRDIAYCLENNGKIENNGNSHNFTDMEKILIGIDR